MTKQLGRRMLTHDQSDSFMAEAEETVRSKPLTLVGEDEDATTILAKDHLLRPNPAVVMPSPSTARFRPRL